MSTILSVLGADYCGATNGKFVSSRITRVVVISVMYWLTPEIWRAEADRYSIFLRRKCLNF